jgi:hypothetical protein
VLHVRILVSTQHGNDDDGRGQNEGIRRSTRSHRSILRQRLSECLLRDMGLRLRYVAFDEGPIYKIDRNPLRWHFLGNYLGRIRDTILFRDRVSDWVDDIMNF